MAPQEIAEEQESLEAQDDPTSVLESTDGSAGSDGPPQTGGSSGGSSGGLPGNINETPDGAMIEWDEMPAADTESTAGSPGNTPSGLGNKDEEGEIP